MLVKRRKASEVSSEQNAYLRSLKQHTRKIMAGRFLLLATFLLLWEIAARQKWIDAFIFSSPSDLAETFWDLLWNGNLLLHFGITLGETLLSFFISTFLGICIAILLWWIPSVYEVTEPYWVALNSLPKSALVWQYNENDHHRVCLANHHRHNSDSPQRISIGRRRKGEPHLCPRRLKIPRHGEAPSAIQYSRYYECPES